MLFVAVVYLHGGSAEDTLNLPIPFSNTFSPWNEARERQADHTVSLIYSAESDYILHMHDFLTVGTDQAYDHNQMESMLDGSILNGSVGAVASRGSKKRRLLPEGIAALWFAEHYAHVLLTGDLRTLKESFTAHMLTGGRALLTRLQVSNAYAAIALVING
jgi:hypothetical protein